MPITTNTRRPARTPRPRTDDNVFEDPFGKYRADSYQFKYHGTLVVDQIQGGIPSNPNVAEAWLKAKLGATSDDQIREMAAKLMVDRKLKLDEAIAEVNTMQHLNGFLRDENTDELYLEARCLKAAVKEAISVAVAVGKIEQRGWGKTRKSINGFFAEHVFVQEKNLHLGVTDNEFKAAIAPPLTKGQRCGITQRFVSTFRGTGIQYEEHVKNVEINFTIEADYEFDEKDWANIWLCGEKQGLGASRSQGYGTYKIIKWEQF